jgi:hypothetical protein
MDDTIDVANRRAPQVEVFDGASDTAERTTSPTLNWFSTRISAPVR